MINIDKIVDEANGDITALYNALLSEFDGDHKKVADTLDDLIQQEEERLEESLREVEKGKEFITRSRSINATREDKAYWTQRDYYKTLYHGKGSATPAPKTKAAKDKAAKLEEESHQKAISEYYSTHEKEAIEDNITLI